MNVYRGLLRRVTVEHMHVEVRAEDHAAATKLLERFIREAPGGVKGVHIARTYAADPHAKTREEIAILHTIPAERGK